MYHFFVPLEQIGTDTLTITGSDVNHIANVLRMQTGERIEVRDGRGSSYLCELTDLERTKVQARIIEKMEIRCELPVRVTLFQGMPKADKLEHIIQKSVELGVAEIIPVLTERTVVKWDGSKSGRKTERWNAIAESAAKQSGRGILPKVLEPMSWKNALEAAKTYDKVFLPYELAENMQVTRDALAGLNSGDSLAVFIGPEGGFKTGEVDEVLALGGQVLTLGPRILRTETAGPAVLAMLTYALEE